jgi:hypothetical protein
MVDPWMKKLSKIFLSGKIGGRAIAFFMSTTLVAVIIGIVLVLL